jgi:CubicO group peptidase (beta-lactamase class C family)
MDSRTSSVRLVDLLTHRGGWHSGLSPWIDAVFHDIPIATYHGTPLPVSKNDIYRYMTLAQPLQFTPNAFEAYSNYGFMMLGEVLEQLNNRTTYEAIVKRDVFTPLGVMRPRIGATSLGQIGSDEVRYHPRHPAVIRSVAVATQPWVPGAYGSWNQGNLDGAGGWVMATCDYAKVLAALSLGANCPIRTGSSLNHMWSPNAPTAPNTLRGWWAWPVQSQGRTMVVRNHNGGLPGTAAMIALREDGFGFCLFLNSDRGLGGTEIDDLSRIADQVTQWPNHDLFPSVGIPSLRTHVVGTYTAFGAGCAGTAGTPLHTGRPTPEVGQAMTLVVGSARASTPLMWMLGFSRTLWNGIPLPLPLNLLGAPGCNLLVAPDITFSSVSSSAGIGSLDLALPASPALIDAHLYSQVAPFDLGANALGFAFSGGLDTRIGGWQ